MGGKSVVAKTPVPFNAEVCGLFAASSTTVSVPLRAPVVVGVNVTLIVQLAPAATEVPQVLVCAKSPVVEIKDMFRAMLCLLVSVSALAELVVDTT